MAAEMSGAARPRVLPQLVHQAQAQAAAEAAPRPGDDQVIGQIIGRLRQLGPEQVEAIAAHQRQHGLRFGEAAVALGLASAADVTWALARQFQYPYQLEGQAGCDAELVVAREPFGEVAEVFRDLRSRLLDGPVGHGVAGAAVHRALAVVSPQRGDGKTFFAANLAVAFSQLGGRTLLIDADMRTPRLHRLFQLQDRLGLSSILAGRASSDVIQPVAAMPNLHVLAVGPPPPNPMELLHRSSLPLLMHDLLAQFDHVLVDTPAAALGADGRVISAVCGTALLIGRQGHSRMAALQAMVDGLRRGSVDLAGVLMNAH